MKHSQTKRILSFLMAALMLVTTSSVLASARWSQNVPYDIQKGKAVMSTGQCATMICDFLDETLAGLDIVVDKINIPGAVAFVITGSFTDLTIWIDLSSIDKMAESLYTTLNSSALDALNSLVGVGDLGLIKVDALGTIKNQFKRSGVGTYPQGSGTTVERDGKRDIYVLQNLFMFFGDNKELLTKLAGSNSNSSLSYKGTFSWGKSGSKAGLDGFLRGEGGWATIIGAFADLSNLEEVGVMMAEMSKDFGGWLKGMLMPSLAPDVPLTTPLDQVLEEMLNEMLGPMLSGLLPGVNLSLDIYQNPGDPPVNSAYDMLRNLLNSVLVGAVPMLLDLLAPMMGIVVDEAHPDGYHDAALGDPLIGGILWGPLVLGGEGVSGILSEAPIPHSMEPGMTAAESAKPYKMLKESIEWLLLRGVDGSSFLDRFLLRNYPTYVMPDGSVRTNASYDASKPKGLVIKDAPAGSKYKDALADFLGTLIDDKLAGLLGMIDLGVELDTEAIKALPLPEKIAFVLKAFLPMIMDYMYVPMEAQTLREVATFILVDMLSDIVPEKRYDLVSRYFRAPENAGKNIDPNLLSTGKQLNPYTDGIYVALGDLLRYYVNPMLTSLNLPENKTFDGVISALSAWIYGSYGGLLRAPLDTDDNGWSRLSYLLFGSSASPDGKNHTNEGILRKDWLTEGIVNNGGNEILKEILVKRLLDGVLELDFKKLFSFFQGNATGELNLPPMQLVLHVIARLLNSVLKVPSGDSLINFNLTTLESLLTGKNLGPLIEQFCVQLGNPTVSSNLLGPALPLLATLLGLWSGNDYLPHLVTAEEVNGIRDPDDPEKWSEKPKPFLAPVDPLPNPSIADFKNLLNLVEPLEQTVEWYVLPNPSNPGAAPYYHHAGPENYLMEDQYRYNFYKDAREAALSIVERMEEGDPELTQYDISNAYAILAFYTNNSWNSGKYAQQPILSSLRSDEQTSNGGLEFQHLRIAFERISKKDYKEENFTRSSWEVFARAYNFAFNLLERYYDMQLKGLTQAAITRARHELIIAERQLAKFSQLANFLAFDETLQSKMEPAERDAYYYNSGDPEVLGSIEYLLKVLAEARVISAERSTYDSSEQDTIDDMVKKMNDAYSALTRRVVIYPDKGARAYYGITVPVPEDPDANNPNIKWKIIYGLPYGITLANGTRIMTDYIHPFIPNTLSTMTWMETSLFRSTLGYKYMGTGAIYKIRTGRYPNVTTLDAAVALIFGDLAGPVSASATAYNDVVYPVGQMIPWGDSMINAKDLQVLDAYLAGRYFFTSMQERAADLNHDKAINAADRELLYQAIQGKASIEQANFNW